MSKARADSRYLVLLGCAVFLLLGIALQVASQIPMGDFKGVYYESRCLIQGRDAYNPTAMEHCYLADGGQFPKSDVEHGDFLNIILTVNLPTTLLLYIPTALIPWDAVRWIWTAFSAGIFMLAACLVWKASVDTSPAISGLLTAGCIAGSELYLILGNPACIVISLCVIAAWCVVQRRFLLLGTVCLAVSLAIKPHDSGFVWLYLLLSGGVNRRIALRALALTLAIAIASVVWVSAVAPGWDHELIRNLAVISSHGGGNDPGPSSIGGHGIGMIISLQTIFSLIWDNSTFYNTATYIICGALLAVWAVKTMRTPVSPKMTWFALAPVSALSMLPVYHRIYDARLLLLAIPACVLLWREGGATAKAAFWLTAAAIFVTSATPWALFLQAIERLPLPAALSSKEAMSIMQVVPVPLTLLIVGTFYLWVYVKRPDHVQDSFESETVF